MTATDVERFWSYVVKGAAPTDCWIWTGAIGDDGYGRFWTLDETAPRGQRVVRPQRFAYTQISGLDLPSTVMKKQHPPTMMALAVELAAGFLMAAFVQLVLLFRWTRPRSR